MSKLIIILFLSMSSGIVLSQSSQEVILIERKGFTFGTSAGAGLLTVSDHDTMSSQFAISLPNLRIGFMVRERLALQLLIPGSVYKNNGDTRAFEGFCISVQYWLKDKLWILGGAGLALDAPAFWSVDDPRKEDFNFGIPAVVGGMGYELWRKKNFTIDIQYRIYVGQVELDYGGQRHGVSNGFSIGFNWY